MLFLKNSITSYLFLNTNAKKYLSSTITLYLVICKNIPGLSKKKSNCDENIKHLVAIDVKLKKKLF